MMWGEIGHWDGKGRVQVWKLSLRVSLDVGEARCFQDYLDDFYVFDWVRLFLRGDFGIHSTGDLGTGGDTSIGGTAE